MKLILILFALSSCSTLLPKKDSLKTAIKAVETEFNATIGVVAFQASGKKISYNGEKRFLMCSTFKLLLCAQVLESTVQGHDSIDSMISVAKEDILPWSPVTKNYIGKKISLGELCQATISLSDNAAANILLKRMGGPKTLTSFLRKKGDKVTRLDRFEPELNRPNGELDTTTPFAMTKTIETLYSTQLDRWLRETKTGENRLKAGLPKTWEIAHKTGSCKNGPSNDVGVIYPPHEEPIFVSVFVGGRETTFKSRETAHQKIAKVISEFFSKLGE